MSWKERKAVATGLEPIYRAATADAAAQALEEFREKWVKHQVVVDLSQRNWERMIPFF